MELIQKAYGAGAQGLDELTRAGGGGRHMKNSRRDLMRALLKNCNMPDLYWAEVPVWNKDTHALELLPFPFLLPHEVCVISMMCISCNPHVTIENTTPMNTGGCIPHQEGPLPV